MVRTGLCAVSWVLRGFRALDGRKSILGSAECLRQVIQRTTLVDDLHRLGNVILEGRTREQMKCTVEAGEK